MHDDALALLCEEDWREFICDICANTRPCEEHWEWWQYADTTLALALMNKDIFGVVTRRLETHITIIRQELKTASDPSEVDTWITRLGWIEHFEARLRKRRDRIHLWKSLYEEITNARALVVKMGIDLFDPLNWGLGTTQW